MTLLDRILSIDLLLCCTKSAQTRCITVWYLKSAIFFPFLATLILMCLSLVCGGYAVAQLVEALRYKPEGRGFDSRWCH